MSKMSVQASGKAGEHEWKPIEKGRGYCSCEFGLNVGFFLSREEWQAHLAFMQAEEAPKPVVSSAHFPRITKHDLEVVVEAMDKLRAALRVEEEAKPALLEQISGHEWRGIVSDLVGECACRYAPKDGRAAGYITYFEWHAHAASIAQAAQLCDSAQERCRILLEERRELIEKLEALELDTDRDRELVRCAVRAARNEGGGK